MNSSTRLTRLGAALLLVPFATHASNLRLFRAGENELDQTPGIPVFETFSVSSEGTFVIQGTGGAFFSGDTAAPGSSSSIFFDGNGSLRGSPLYEPLPGPSFGMEVWFKPASISGTQGLFYNGDTAMNGFGLYVVDGTLNALRGGIAFNPSAVIPQAGVWNHAALVWDSGQGRLS